MEVLGVNCVLCSFLKCWNAHVPAMASITSLQRSWKDFKQNKRLQPNCWLKKRSPLFIRKQNKTKKDSGTCRSKTRNKILALENQITWHCKIKIRNKKFPSQGDSWFHPLLTTPLESRGTRAEQGALQVFGHCVSLAPAPSHKVPADGKQGAGGSSCSAPSGYLVS